MCEQIEEGEGGRPAFKNLHTYDNSAARLLFDTSNSKKIGARIYHTKQ